MTIRQLIEATQGLNPDMEIFIDDGNMLSPLCGKYEVAKIAIGETLEETEILMLRPCECNMEEDEDAIENINLN